MNKPKAIAIVVVVLLCSLFVIRSSWMTKKLAPCGDCNVIVIGVDTFRADHISGLGYKRVTTPTLDALAKDSTVFAEAISPSSWTVPSFMSIMTGMYPSVHGVINKYTVFNKDVQKLSNLKEISPSVKTFAEQMKNAGYATGGFTGDAGVSAKFGYNQGFDAYTDEKAFGGFENSNAHAIKWLDELPKGKKFFMFYHGYDMHGQFAIPKDYKGTFAPADYAGQYKGTAAEEAKLREDQLVAPISLTKEDAAFWTAWYDSKMHDADAQLAVFLKQLADRGLLEKTVIAVVSDHGEEFYEHGGIDHGQSLYDELVHVPLMLKIPGVKGGAVVKSQVGVIDLAPTLLSILGVTPDSAFAKQASGRKNLLDFVKEPTLSGYDVYSETDYRAFIHLRSVRTADGWKYVRALVSGKEELYNITKDPAELTNLIASNTEKAIELRAKLDAHIVNELHADPKAKPEIGCLPVYKGECE